LLREIEQWFADVTEESADKIDSSVSVSGVLYQAMSRYTEAEMLYRRSLAIYEKRLGANHPHTTTTLNNLIELYRAAGKNSEAEQLLASRNQT
jgi:tetratricopeptide (TPR) repeat protein